MVLHRSSRALRIGGHSFVSGGVRRKRRGPRPPNDPDIRPGIAVAAVQHADGRLRKSRYRVHRFAVRTDRSVIYRVFIIYFKILRLLVVEDICFFFFFLSMETFNERNLKETNTKFAVVLKRPKRGTPTVPA